MDKNFVINFTLNITLSLIFSFLFSPLITKNTDAMNLIASVFSILSGFLFIVITAIGELFIFKKGDTASQRIKKYHNFEIRFTRFSSLFVLYLSVLALIFIHYLLNDMGEVYFSIFEFKISIHSIQKWMSYIISFFTMSCLLASARLPWSYKKLLEEINEIT